LSSTGLGTIQRGFWAGRGAMAEGTKAARKGGEGEKVFQGREGFQARDPALFCRLVLRDRRKQTGETKGPRERAVSAEKTRRGAFIFPQAWRVPGGHGVF